MIPEYEDSPVVEFTLGDGKTYRGFLGIGEIKQLRRVSGMGPVKMARILADDPDPEHISEIVRLALVGGGMDPEQAASLSEYYCQPPRPMEAAWHIAMAMMGAWWKGIPKDGRKKASRNDTEDIDVSMWEAQAAAVGISVEALHKMSVGEWIQLRRHFDKDEQSEAPGSDVLNAIKATRPKPKE